jgi:hypothetical protein
MKKIVLGAFMGAILGAFMGAILVAILGAFWEHFWERLWERFWEIMVAILGELALGALMAKFKIELCRYLDSVLDSSSVKPFFVDVNFVS